MLREEKKPLYRKESAGEGKDTKKNDLPPTGEAGTLLENWVKYKRKPSLRGAAFVRTAGFSRARVS